MQRVAIIISEKTRQRVESASCEVMLCTQFLVDNIAARARRVGVEFSEKFILAYLDMRGIGHYDPNPAMQFLPKGLRISAPLLTQRTLD